MIKMFYAFLVFACLFISCQNGANSDSTQKKIDALVKGETFEASPFVSPEESLKKMVVENGFEVKLIVSEPLISSPVALNFDNKGRMWVVEMNGYMHDAEGTGEETPNGKIVILEDQNKDGIVDVRKVFMDSLVLPRALCLIENGILIAESPNLWYVEIINDKPGKKVLVDKAYTEGTNVEAQSNGLFRAMDNWIYSGGSAKRYRKNGDKWLTERTHLRGQWGITQDDYGRLYYNNNSQNLLGDYFSPGLGASNENLQRVKGFTERLTSDNRVYPARPTTGVNRGYKDNILDSTTHRLVNFTAACSPVLYRADLFDKEYYNNVFVAEPAANLIKRNILTENGYTVSAKQAYEGREFLVSIDERFRPVSLYNGPDGALYVVDMYRGIIQHKSFLTDYLKSEIQKRALDKPVNCGRIYKIVPKNKLVKSIMMPDDPEKLVDLLQDPNGWVRDRAQQMLIDGKFTQVLPHLRKLVKNTKKTTTMFHAIWTMEGLGVLQADDILPLLENTDWKVKAQALSVLPSVVTKKTYKQFMPVLEQMIERSDTLVAPYLAFQVWTMHPFDKTSANNLLLKLVKKYPSNAYVADAIISNLKGQEIRFSEQAIALNSDTSLKINKQLKKVIADIKSNAKNKNANLLKKQFPRGASVFKSTCQACHGADGNGLASLAPPLNKSEWVQGDKDKLISILLFGLTGPVTVNNKLYKAPEINGDMPAIGNNKDIVDEDIAQLLSFIRKSWSNNAEKVTREEVIKIRRKFRNRQNSFTVEELMKM